ncbi:hypothetical protein TGAM01_v211101 [Trichoderma gamsii]|uniref:Uncharacterized protein n=1 Tax=Trichoderma gamsii TaxID=398673 RepID=A0A2K0TFX6_9HYPO|nr:hypothetical protein TGAM01_v211101 [Trichoderma gamsii]PNP44419.1 hypothetical protein TGAMA5MH_03822 [Trichoderma gamsii]PON20024.1 hypothetical protein TGAM01_v211101 [Trichoderma gamsii]
MANPPQRPAISLAVRVNLQSVDATLRPTPPQALDVLSNFRGTFIGNGFNTIWRPSSGSNTFPNPVPAGGNNKPDPVFPNESILELNLTTEEMTFTDNLGSIPNRGLKEQKDLILSGVSYLQVVRDVTNPKSGRADDTPRDIHFEPGLWIKVPADNNNAESLARMASIPHGTTINAQCLAPTTRIQNGNPAVNDIVDITPFPIARPNGRLNNQFPAMNVTNMNTSRLPQDLNPFVTNGTITQAILNNPNTVLVNANRGKTIVSMVTFEVSTAPSSAKQSDSDGISNIAFLEGKSLGPTSRSTAVQNADAALMTARFWISDVQCDIVVPPFRAGENIRIQPNNDVADPRPTFTVDTSISNADARTIQATFKQIQYSQVVNLDFDGLTWPHVSVATLVPAEDILISLLH